ncbi:MAG: PrgI family protein [Patescibacteria group bacterium]
MPIDPVKIPQNVYIEDRIVGPLTLKQVMIIALGGGFSYVLYAFAGKAAGGQLGLVPTVLVWIPAALAVVFALVKVNDLSLLRIVLLSIEKMNKPPERVWTPRRGLTIHIRTGGAREVEKTEKHKERLHAEIASAQKTENRIQELSSVLDHPLTQPQDPVPEPSPPPVDRGSVQVDDTEDGTEPPDDLSAYKGIFRDLSPNP